MISKNQRLTLLACTGALLSILAGCQFLSLLFPAPAANDLDLSLETVVANASFPVDLAFASDSRVFYTELATGNIRVIKDGQLLSTPFASVPCNHFGERGLLGIDLDPDFANSLFVYVYYTRSISGMVSTVADDAQENRVVRFPVNGDVAGGPEQILISLPIGSPGNHNGGIIRFGPDHNLYVSIGDVGNSDNAQNPTVFAGKILRIDATGNIPADNPFGPASAVYAIGVRNTFGLAFDPVRLFANENGPGNHDEVNIIEAGANYGWPEVEGFADNGFGDPASETDFAASHPEYRDPIMDKSDESVGASGLVVNLGTRYGASRVGHIFFSRLNLRRVMDLGLSDSGQSAATLEVLFDQFPEDVVGLRMAPDGILWATMPSSIVKIVPPSP